MLLIGFFDLNFHVLCKINILKLKFVVMYQLEKMSFIWTLLNILKPNFQTYNWFCADGSHIIYLLYTFDITYTQS